MSYSKRSAKINISGMVTSEYKVVIPTSFAASGALPPYTSATTAVLDAVGAAHMVTHTSATVRLGNKR